jgi:hypothetical protein
MVKPQRNKSEPGLLGKGQRYWSVMLVGEHGRVIPFRHFKQIAIAVISLACLSLAALAVIGYLYSRQTETIGNLQREVDALRRQTVQLKDEKDVLHAKLVIDEMQKPPDEVQKPKGKEMTQAAQKAAATPGAPTPAPQESRPAATASPPPQPTATPTPTSTPMVKWVVELQRFEAQYDAPRELIKLAVRVQNKTATRQTFSGRIVLVLTQAQGTPKRWVSLPSVPLVEGKPTGKNGQAFTVQNYRTMDFKLHKQRPPIDFDTAMVFVFLSDGELVSSKDFQFHIETPPPPTATPEPEVQATPTPTPSPEATPPIPMVPPMTSPVPAPGDAAGDSGGKSQPGSATVPVPTTTPSQGPPQATVPPAPAVIAPAASPIPVPEKALEAEPTR